jgi:hypothetical protein
MRVSAAARNSRSSTGAESRKNHHAPSAMPKKSKGFSPSSASFAEVSSFPLRRKEEIVLFAVPKTAAAVNDQRGICKRHESE